MHKGLILKGIGGFYYIKSGSNIYECKPRGIFRKERITPVPGDWVEVSIIDEDNKKGVIESICPRKNHLIRPPVSNIDQMVVAFAAVSPAPDFMLLDKLLIMAAKMEISPIICLNKIDLCGDANNILKSYENIGYQVNYVSAVNGIGIEKLKELLSGKISILAGPSGVGKSTIINSLKLNIEVKTGDISSKIERGKHTTRHVEFFETENGGYLADAPGFSLLNIDSTPSEKIQDYYPEFGDYVGLCRFSGCSHISEPSCAVKDAVDNQAIDAERYNRYKELYETIKKDERYKK